MVEFSSPNTNKPLHLGHLRNDALGESVSRILAANGAEVLKINLINDRGVHICKSMLAYMAYGEGRTPSPRGSRATTSWGTTTSGSTTSRRRTRRRRRRPRTSS
ncbi:MAG: arginine--tRNA ligase [Candidatus Moduliflexus flocculans]|nr:arginine--tRNA ligase [Candidatus Moduliflexus flocculans]